MHEMTGLIWLFCDAPFRFQFDALVDKLTGREMLVMFAKLRGIPSRKIPEVVNAVIYQLNLGEWADKLCGNYR